ncbi:MAG: type II toxin-antitoxin system VapC family toxin [Sphingomonadales bacterium]|nr:MAG: type II toxin-antitoxin system VapC family toxin [Sphingomonadales bacterium]
MILVDTSVWADHFRQTVPALSDLLGAGDVLMHPFVIGELALGNLQRRDATLRLLRELPSSNVVTDDRFAEESLAADLVASGIGFVDAHLLLAVRAQRGTSLWSRDKRLAAKASALGIRWDGETT